MLLLLHVMPIAPPCVDSRFRPFPLPMSCNRMNYSGTESMSMSCHGDPDSSLHAHGCSCDGCTPALRYVVCASPVLRYVMQEQCASPAAGAHGCSLHFQCERTHFAAHAKYKEERGRAQMHVMRRHIACGMPDARASITGDMAMERYSFCACSVHGLWERLVPEHLQCVWGVVVCAA